MVNNLKVKKVKQGRTCPLHVIKMIRTNVSAHGPVDRKTGGATQCWIDSCIGCRVGRRSSKRAPNVVGLGFGG